jgi:hypothetical protein
LWQNYGPINIYTCICLGHNKTTLPQYNWNIVESGVKHHKPNQANPWIGVIKEDVTILRLRVLWVKAPQDRKVQIRKHYVR